jgi:hypothetical protein
VRTALAEQAVVVSVQRINVGDEIVSLKQDGGLEWHAASLEQARAGACDGRC